MADNLAHKTRAMSLSGPQDECDESGSRVKQEGAPIHNLFAEDHEPGGFKNLLPANMPARAAEAQKVLFADPGEASGSASSGLAAGHQVEEPTAKRVCMELVCVPLHLHHYHR